MLLAATLAIACCATVAQSQGLGPIGATGEIGRPITFPATSPPRCYPPCQNGGSCRSQNGRNRCTCRPGYTGRYCETEIDAKPGRCPPYHPIPIPCPLGPRCSHDSQCRASQKCCSVPCPGTCNCPILSDCNLSCPHGRRTDSAGCSLCRCNPPPFCRPGCENGGTCAAGNTCTCRAGFTGRRCENPICSGGCQNGGTCTGVNTCTCPVGFTGMRCQNAASVGCDPDCQNGGTCNVVTGRCSCPPMFSGPTCEGRLPLA